MESFFLVLRVLVSLAVVFGLLFYLRKRLASRFGTPRAPRLEIVERRNLGPKSSVVLLDVAGRRYLLGVAESSVSVLDSFEAPEPLPDPAPEAAARNTAIAERSRAFAQSLLTVRTAPVSPDEPVAAATGDDPRPTGPSPAAADPLAGSILSAQTWRRAAAALRSGRGA